MAANVRYLLIAVAASAWVLATAAEAQQPDLSGIWVAAPGFHHGRGAFLALELPFTDAGRAAWQAYDQAQDNALRCSIDYGRITGSSVLPLEIVQQEHIVYLLYEYEHQVRRIYLEGLSDVPNQPPSYVGLSVGHWDQDTLVVRVERLHAGYFFERGYGPYSSQAKIIERFQLAPDARRLIVTRTIDDPLFFTEPFDWTTEYIPGESILPYECEIREYLESD